VDADLAGGEAVGAAGDVDGRPAWMRSREAAASGDGAVTLSRWRISQSMAQVFASNTSGSCSWNSTFGSHCTWDTPWVQISVPMP
jgi:hypothetical protein